MHCCPWWWRRRWWWWWRRRRRRNIRSWWRRRWWCRWWGNFKTDLQILECLAIWCKTDGKPLVSVCHQIDRWILNIGGNELVIKQVNWSFLRHHLNSFNIRGDAHGAQIVKPANRRDTNRSQRPRQRPVRSSQVPNTGTAVQQEVQGPVFPQVILTRSDKYTERIWEKLKCMEIGSENRWDHTETSFDQRHWKPSWITCYLLLYLICCRH